MKKMILKICATIAALFQLLTVVSAETEPNNKIINGICYSNDMKTLISVTELIDETDVTIPVGVETIKENAFYGPGYSIKTLHLPKGLKTIEEYAFSGMHELEEIYIPVSAENGIANTAFHGCVNLKRIILAPNNDAAIVFNVGDVNSLDGITAADARYTLQIAAKLREQQPWDIYVADVTRDGKITAADARIILKTAAAQL